MTAAGRGRARPGAAGRGPARRPRRSARRRRQRQALRWPGPRPAPRRCRQRPAARRRGPRQAARWPGSRPAPRRRRQRPAARRRRARQAPRARWRARSRPLRQRTRHDPGGQARHPAPLRAGHLALVATRPAPLTACPAAAKLLVVRDPAGHPNRARLQLVELAPPPSRGRRELSSAACASGTKCIG